MTVDYMFKEADEHNKVVHEELEKHVKVDPDGEIVSIKDLHLVLVGSLADEPPAMNPQHMKDFAVAVAKTGTYTQRHLPFRQKVILLWKIFTELFFGKSYVEREDPYVMVAEQWFRKQQVPVPTKEKLRLLWRRIRDMFVYTPQAEPIDTFGMPGFQSFRKAKS